jgi:hypothetical protein
MSTNQEHDSGISSDSKAADDVRQPSNAELFRMLLRLKLKHYAGYVLDGFAPFVAVAALIIAVIALNGNKSSQAQLVQLSQHAARIESLNASLLASRDELEKLKAAMAQEKALQEAAHSKQDERVTQIIPSVSRLQAKMKISPTLEEQMHQPAAAVAPADASATTPAVKTTAEPLKAAVLPAIEKKPGDRMSVLKESIEKFNKK